MTKKPPGVTTLVVTAGMKISDADAERIARQLARVATQELSQLAYVGDGHDLQAFGWSVTCQTAVSCVAREVEDMMMEHLTGQGYEPYEVTSEH